MTINFFNFFSLRVLIAEKNVSNLIRASTKFMLYSTRTVLKSFVRNMSAAVPPDAGPGVVPQNLKIVLNKVNTLAGEVNRDVRLVAVSKKKDASYVQAAYDAGQRHFGENYVQELIEKSKELESLEEIRWRFIGHLQSNKANQLVKQCVNLSCVETVDSEKLANSLQKACVNAERKDTLDVMVQVNTSGEESKSGVQPGEEADGLAKYIFKECPGLRLVGFMTIGMPDYSGARMEDFERLQACRDTFLKTCGAPSDGDNAMKLELSMGMSSDYEMAIRSGSDSVRLGTSIFGARPPIPPKEPATGYPKK